MANQTNEIQKSICSRNYILFLDLSDLKYWLLCASWTSCFTKPGMFVLDRLHVRNISHNKNATGIRQVWRILALYIKEAVMYATGKISYQLVEVKSIMLTETTISTLTSDPHIISSINLFFANKFWKTFKATFLPSAMFDWSSLYSMSNGDP